MNTTTRCIIYLKVRLLCLFINRHIKWVYCFNKIPGLLATVSILLCLMHFWQIHLYLRTYTYSVFRSVDVHQMCVLFIYLFIHLIVYFINSIVFRSQIQHKFDICYSPYSLLTTQSGLSKHNTLYFISNSPNSLNATIRTIETQYIVFYK